MPLCRALVILSIFLLQAIKSCFIQSFTINPPVGDLRIAFASVVSWEDFIFGGAPILSIDRGCRVLVTEGHCWLIRSHSLNEPLSTQQMIIIPGDGKKVGILPGDRLILFKSKRPMQMEIARGAIACFLKERHLLPERFPGSCSHAKHDNPYLLLFIGGPASGNSSV